MYVTTPSIRALRGEESDSFHFLQVNSVLFYEVGGTTRVASSLLALSSFGVLIAGPGVIGFLPICVVAALIFILGIDLVKEVRLHRSFAL